MGSKLKPMCNFRQDIREGDLVRVVFKNGGEVTGYINYGGETPSKDTSLAWISTTPCRAGGDYHAFAKGCTLSPQFSRGYEVLRRAK